MKCKDCPFQLNQDCWSDKPTCGKTYEDNREGSGEEYGYLFDKEVKP